MMVWQIVTLSREWQKSLTVGLLLWQSVKWPVWCLLIPNLFIALFPPMADWPSILRLKNKWELKIGTFSYEGKFFPQNICSKKCLKNISKKIGRLSKKMEKICPKNNTVETYKSLHYKSLRFVFFRYLFLKNISVTFLANFVHFT